MVVLVEIGTMILPRLPEASGWDRVNPSRLLGQVDGIMEDGTTNPCGSR